MKRRRERANHALVIYTKTGEYCADFYLKRGGGEEEEGEEERERERELRSKATAKANYLTKRLSLGENQTL